MWLAKHNIIKWNEHKQFGALVPLALSNLAEGQQMKVWFSSLLNHVCENQRARKRLRQKTQDRMWDIAWFSAQAQPPHYRVREWREVLLCALYKAWAETSSLSKYYYRQQFPTEFNVETQRVRLGDHAPASHLKTSFDSHLLQRAHTPWSLYKAKHLWKQLSSIKIWTPFYISQATTNRIEDNQWSSRYRLEWRYRVLERFHCFILFDCNHIHGHNKMLHVKETVGSLSELDSYIDCLCC